MTFYAIWFKKKKESQVLHLRVTLHFFLVSFIKEIDTCMWQGRRLVKSESNAIYNFTKIVLNN